PTHEAFALLPTPQSPDLPELRSGAATMAAAGRAPASFAKILDGFLHQGNTAEHHADDMVESLALGEPVDVHQVMLALNEASNARSEEHTSELQSPDHLVC